MSDAAFALNREAEAARSLLKDLGLIGSGETEAADADAELARDTVEGETNLLEAIDTTYASILEDEALETGLSAIIGDLSARKTAIGKRRDMKKALIQRALEMTGLDAQKIVRPAVTIFMSKRAPKLRIVDESLIPARFFVEPPKPDPVLDKKALEAELKARATDGAEAEAVEPIPGAELDNGGASINFRRK